LQYVGAGFIPALEDALAPMNLFLERKKIRLPKAVYQVGLPFSITIGTFERYPWFQRYRELAGAAVELLNAIAGCRETTLYAWCIMPDHVHLLVESKDVIAFIRLFKGQMTTRARYRDPLRRLWQRSFYDHALRRDESLEAVAHYIWENPVRKGFVAVATDYAWSGSAVWPNWREFYGRG
jgi:REP-associated tyrosine transposase